MIVFCPKTYKGKLLNICNNPRTETHAFHLCLLLLNAILQFKKIQNLTTEPLLVLQDIYFPKLFIASWTPVNGLFGTINEFCKPSLELKVLTFSCGAA